MRILHLVNHCRLGHGNVHAAVDLACVQSARGDTVYYGSEGGELHNLLIQEKVRRVNLRQRSRNPLILLRSLVHLVQIVRRDRIEVVHAHMMSGAVLGYLATRVTRARLVTTVHNSFDRHSMIMRLGDRIVTVSTAERQNMIKRGFSAARLTSIVNGPLGGARERFFQKQDSLDLPHPNVTTVCGLHARKGVDYLIEAFKLVQKETPCFLNIVGDGPDRKRLEAVAVATGFADRIRFHGSQSDPRQILRASDIFVLASLAEPFGLVNIEARSVGCAVIATAVGGVAEALDGGLAGTLVPPGDAPAIARAIFDLLSDADKLRQGQTSALRNLERFGVERLYEEYRDVYETLTGPPRSAVVADPSA
ncbi:glycosyltransferase family 4 protein [Methylobacterium sp. J-077]|uniref:glycosyltransferase family 4 protein n=1 Tax=Methylobacterium sp. J-077 TaxID=2836656 RepID=UPI001FB917A7|nr:glycosyltransferase family 4 protein [Methylobacterium sp. J-077]MCJ2121691.1 glycosyltransferase family 4 protein [Methylobacterium sp. J-077]